VRKKKGEMMRGSPLAVVSVLVAVVVAAMLTQGAAPAAAVVQRSARIAIVEGGGEESTPPLQTSGSVEGVPEDSFEQFSFQDITQEEIEAPTLAQYDTVVLNQVFTETLSAAQQQALSAFVTSGGKLIIHDADGTEGNNYSWLPVPAETGASCQNCGHTDGVAEIVEDNTLVSSDPSSPDYIDVEELPGNSDAVGDANVLVTEDPRWDVDIRATNSQNVNGAVHAYATDGGLIIYNGLDDDAFEYTFPAAVGWPSKLWYQELDQQWNPDNLPHSNPASGGGGGPIARCGGEALKVGVVGVCAEKIATTGSETVATGHVVLDSGISIGEGPLDIDQETKQLSTPAPVPVALLRSSGTLALGSTSFTIEAAGSTDPISGKTGLAKVALTGANLGPLGTLRVGGLPFSLPLSGSITMYLDSAQDGGLIGAGTLQLPVLGALHTSAALSLGFYANTPQPVVALGGGVSFGAVDLGDGWAFEGLDLSYQEPTDTWSAAGGLAVPIGSLHANGSLVGGQLNSLGVEIGGQAVPLGDTGFFFSEFGGAVSGLAKGPLKISASTGGFWGVPKSPVEPIYLQHVTVTVDLGGAVDFSGKVSLALADDSPLTGEIDLQLGFAPFSATGSFKVTGSLPGVSLALGGGAGFTTKHFTASEHGDLHVFGLSGSGDAVISDAGMGASGQLCSPKIFGVGFCQSLAFAGTWKQIGALDVPDMIGGDPQRLVTVPGVSAAGHPTAIRVPRGRALLLLAVHGSEGAPALRLRAPDGHVYGSARASGPVLVSHQPRFGLTVLTVVHPQPGVWRVSAAPGTHAVLQVHAQTVRPIKLIHAFAVARGGSRHHPLGIHARARALLRWSSLNLPPEVRVRIVRRSHPHQVGAGVPLAAGLSARDSLKVPVGELLAGPNYFTLQATLHGVPFQDVSFPGAAWRAAPRSRHRAGKHATHGHTLAGGELP
jgi:hypothetical protein